MKEFKKFSSIENSYRVKYLELLKQYTLDDGTFVVSEKIHGANFSIWYDGTDLKCAKRSAFLKEDDNFSNFQEVRDRLRPNIQNLHTFLRVSQQNIEDPLEVAVYGELFGGSYPHKDVSVDPGAKKIQKGIHYCPHNDFYAFDIRVNGVYLSVPEANDLFNRFGFLHAETLFEGSLKNCLEYKNEFQTTVPGKFQLPQIDDNFCEGVVIRPVEPRFFPNGSRVILKNKNAKWEEKSKASDRKPKIEVQLTDEEQRLYHEFHSLVTENRLVNVLSKFGPVGQKDFGKLLGEFSRDISEEFNKDFNEAFGELNKSVQKIIKGKVQKAASKIIRDHYVNIIDGTWP